MGDGVSKIEMESRRNMRAPKMEREPYYSASHVEPVLELGTAAEEVVDCATVIAAPATTRSVAKCIMSRDRDVQKMNKYIMYQSETRSYMGLTTTISASLGEQNFTEEAACVNKGSSLKDLQEIN